MRIDINKAGEHPRGSILMLTLVVLLLMSLMGAAILANTRTELVISANTTGGRDAFTRADTAARVATLMARLLAHEFELGSPKQVLNNSSPLTVIYDDDHFSFAKLLAASDDFNYAKRYLSAASRTDLSDSADKADLRPHLVFRQDGKVVSTATVAMDYGEALTDGCSLGQTGYDTSGGLSVRVVLAVTVNGRPPYDGPAAGGAESSAEKAKRDNYGTYDRDGASAGEEANDVPHSVVTTLFREMF